ncbi:DNA mismatch repair protein MSH6 [Pancytospora epiphaga]|nr:DNA mismatch repair protein MSH6 [Pancytospora epiphaga]
MAKKTLLDYFSLKEPSSSPEDSDIHSTGETVQNLAKGKVEETVSNSGSMMTSCAMEVSLPNSDGIFSQSNEIKEEKGGCENKNTFKDEDCSEMNIKRPCIDSTPSSSVASRENVKNGIKNPVSLLGAKNEDMGLQSLSVYDDNFLSSQVSASSDTRYSFMMDNSGVSTRKEENRFPFMIDVRDKNGIPEGAEGYDPTSLYIPDSCYKKFTPFERQFWDIKRNHFDVVIMFKKGAFYELYERDADIAARLFDFRTTGRVNMKMAGFPERNYDTWASKLLEHGYKIGRVEQTENSIGKKIREKNGEKGDKIIARELKEVVTSGTIYCPDQITSVLPFYTAVIVRGAVSGSGVDERTHFSVLLYDASINQMHLLEIIDRQDLSGLKGMMVQNDIREIISDVDLKTVTRIKAMTPDYKAISSERMYEFPSDEAFKCYGYLYNYMELLCREDALKTACIAPLKATGSFTLDGGTLTNLDILTNNYDGTEEHSLYKTINYCITPFGKRLLRRWLLNPLTCIEEINKRRCKTEIFVPGTISSLIEALQQIGDAERSFGRLSNPNPSFKDLSFFIKSMKMCIKFLEEIRGFVLEIKSENVPIAEDSITQLSNGIRNFLEGFFAEYTLENDEVTPGCRNDELASLNLRHKQIEASISKYLEDIRGKYGLNMLAYKSINKDIYQVEAPTDVKMPPEFYVVSTTKACKRYYSPALRLLITDLQETEERVFQSKGNLFRKAVEFTFTQMPVIREAINFIAEVDCYISISLFNTSSDTSVPIFVDASEGMSVHGCRSPVFPSHVRNDFVPRERITMVTGPNMGGKSTFLRSICLNIVLAQAGMNVTCDAMKMPVFSQIFTRIGASDSLARGESTFMVELNEAARIMRNATESSFVIMDELGRGTSTQDGNAIARAVLDYLKSLGCYTLFSTHYHELVSAYEGVDKVFVDCAIDGNDIVFLYRIREGVCMDSHGLYVARMAGVPGAIVQKASAIRESIVHKS